MNNNPNANLDTNPETTASNRSVANPDAQPELLQVTMWDNSVSTVRLFRPSPSVAVGEHGGKAASDSPSTQRESGSYEQPLIVIWPGWGVGARYYDPLGRELARRGYPVVTGELHGQGSSTAKPSRTHSYGYHHMASNDFPETIYAAKRAFGLAAQHPTFFICHSMGGQVASLFAARPEAAAVGLQGVMGVGTGSPHWRGFVGREKIRLRWGTLWMRLMVALFGYQPDGRLDLAGYGAQPRGHFSEWYRFVHTNRLYRLQDEDMDYEQAKLQLEVPFLLTRYVDDADCTIQSCANLALSLPSAYVTVEELPERLGHNSWARNPQAPADRLEAFIQDVAGA